MSGEYTEELLEKGISFLDRLATEFQRDGFKAFGVSFGVDLETSGGLYFFPKDSTLEANGIDLAGVYGFYATPFFEGEPVLPVAIEIDGFLEKNESYYIAPNKLDTYERFKNFVIDGIREAIESDILDIKSGEYNALNS